MIINRLNRMTRMILIFLGPIGPLVLALFVWMSVMLIDSDT